MHCHFALNAGRLLAALAAVLAACAGHSGRGAEPEDQKKPSNPALRSELLEMMRVDQEARKSLDLNDKTSWPEVVKTLERIDRRHTERMKAIVAEHGWPGTSTVGRDGASAAWLLVQHAGKAELEFMERSLELIEAAATRGEASPKDVAYLLDRVRMYQGKPQRFGTQFTQGADGRMVPHPIEDEAHLDQRRKALGMSSMSEQQEVIRQTYEQPRATPRR
jgi:uncharacterized protein DUF6624